MVCRGLFVFVFFFSSRRRHTRFDCDWSSDVCSSDLVKGWRLHNMIRREFAQVMQEVDLLAIPTRSEEHTSELQSQSNLVCRLLLEKKKKKTNKNNLQKNKHKSSHSYKHQQFFYVTRA